jgi:hypothetical protein
MGGELKPCPFCGNDYIKVDRMRFGMQAWCPECLAHGPTTQVAPGGTAQSAWNDLRAAEDDLRTRAEAAEQRAEAAEVALAQAHADRTLMTGLWLATAPPDVLPALLPVDPGDRDRLAAALDAVDLQPSAESHTAAARAIIGRIVRVVAEMTPGAQ